MSHSTPHGIYSKSLEKFMWHFTSRSEALRLFDITSKTDLSRVQRAIKSKGEYPLSEVKYVLKKMTTEQVAEINIDHNKDYQVKALVENDLDWNPELILETNMRVCIGCKVSKPETTKYFSYETDYFRTTCRTCRTAQIVHPSVPTDPTFACPGTKFTAAHTAKTEDRLEDRILCRSCYNTLRSNRDKLKTKSVAK